MTQDALKQLREAIMSFYFNLSKKLDLMVDSRAVLGHYMGKVLSDH